MSNKADRESVLRSVKVRTCLKGDGTWIKHSKNAEEEKEEKSRRTTELNASKTAISPQASPGIANTASTSVERVPDNNKGTSAGALKDITIAAMVTSEPSVSPQEASLESTPLEGSVKGNTSAQEALPKTKADVTTFGNVPNASESSTQRSTAHVPTDDNSSLEDDSSQSASIPKDTAPKVEIPDSSAAQCVKVNGNATALDFKAEDLDSTLRTSMVTDAKEVPSPEQTSAPAACFADAEEHKPPTLETSNAPAPSAAASTVISDCTQAVLTTHTKDVSTPNHSFPSAQGTTEGQVPKRALQESVKPELVNQEAPSKGQTDVPLLSCTAEAQEPTPQTSADCETSTEGAPSQREREKYDELAVKQASGPEEPERKPRTSSTDNNAGQDKATIITPATASTEKTMENLESKVQDPPCLESRPEESTQVPEEKRKKMDHPDVCEAPSTGKSSSNVCTICGNPFAEDCRITMNHLNISWHTSCFKCVVCSKPMGDLLQNMYLHGDMVCCESCYFNIS